MPSALAAWKILSPQEVANQLGDNGLCKAFQSEDAIEINETIRSNGYTISFLGLVSGKSLSDFEDIKDKIYPERTYAIVAIAKENGSPMPNTRDEAFKDIKFFVSPLIKGEKPWLYNIASVNGSYTEKVINGVLYRLIECDDLEIFADRGLYLCVSNTNFYSVEAFNYNEKTGEITPNPEFDGINVLFELPLDPKKANPEEAEKYLRELNLEDSPNTNSKENSDDLIESNNTDKNSNNIDNNTSGNDKDSSNNSNYNIDDLMEVAVLIPESVKEVTYTDTGSMVYEYKDHRLQCDVGWIFPDGETGLSEAVSIQEDDKEILIRRFNKDENGVITGMIYKVIKDN